MFLMDGDFQGPGIAVGLEQGCFQTSALRKKSHHTVVKE